MEIGSCRSLFDLVYTRRFCIWVQTAPRFLLVFLDLIRNSALFATQTAGSSCVSFYRGKGKITGDGKDGKGVYS
jgi:hypothetical protein